MFLKPAFTSPFALLTQTNLKSFIFTEPLDFLMKFKDLQISWLGHDTFKIKGKEIVVYTDPFKVSEGEKADLILVSHEHFDHCDLDSIKVLTGEYTEIVGSKGAIEKIGRGKALAPGEKISVKGVEIKAVQAYNVNKFRAPGVPFHPKGLGVGFIFVIDGVKLYHAGDTDYIPEMNKLVEEKIDIAFLPISGTYVMTEEEAAEAVKAIKPKIAIPMHYGTLKGIGGDPEKFKKLVESEVKETEVKILSY